MRWGWMLGAVALVGALSTTALAQRPASREPIGRGFTVAATGDILPELRVLLAGAAAAGLGERYDFGPMFAPHGEVVAAADLAICHVEVPLGLPGAPVGAQGRSLTANRLIGPAELAPAIAGAGYDRCSTASNHSYDGWDRGIDSTLAVLDQAGVGHVGTARSPQEERASAAPFPVNGVRVSHLAWSTATNTELPERWRFHHTPRRAAPVLAEIAAARQAGAEVVIVSVHVGRENEPAPIPADRAFVEAITATGEVDLVIGHGPHVVQPVEQVNGTWVFWSVGNLVSGMPESSPGRYAASARDGLLAWAEVRVAPDGTVDVAPTAVLLCNQAADRTIWPALPALADPTISPTLADELTACHHRAAQVVTPLS